MKIAKKIKDKKEQRDEKSFVIEIKTSALPYEEKRKLLRKCINILLFNKEVPSIKN